MSRKIITILVFIAIFLALSQKVSFAQVVPTEYPQPGVNCGNPYMVGDAQKCCKSPIIKPGTFSFNNIILDGGVAVLQPLINSATDEMVQKQRSVVMKACTDGSPSAPQTSDSCVCVVEAPKAPLSAFEPMCASLNSPSEQTLCINCSHNTSGVWTALGCFNGNVSEFIANNIMRTGIGIGGGISLLCIMLAAFQMQTSGGSAEKIKKAQELLTNCITGLMVIIFSVLILKIIGVDILKIPGFN